MKRTALAIVLTLMSMVAIGRDYVKDVEVVNADESYTLVSTMGNQFTFYDKVNLQRVTMTAFAFDMPQTFGSGSCIAAGDILVLRQPQMVWYCYNTMGWYMERLD